MANQRPILIVTNDPAVHAVLTAQFASTEDFIASVVTTAAEAELILGAPDARFDVVLLDVNLPDRDGHALCLTLRQSNVTAPIILLNASSHDNDVIRGLEAGANDYVALPCSMVELQARLRAHLRTFENSENLVISIGPYTFRPGARLLQEPLRNRRIRLTQKEAAILKFLYRAGTRAVGRQELLNEVWGYNTAVDTHTLETHIYRVRQKMEPDPSKACILLTANGGYRLNPASLPLAA